MLHRISLLLIGCLMLFSDKSNAQLIIIEGDALGVGIGPSPYQILQQSVILSLDFNSDHRWQQSIEIGVSVLNLRSIVEGQTGTQFPRLDGWKNDLLLHAAYGVAYFPTSRNHYSSYPVRPFLEMQLVFDVEQYKSRNTWFWYQGNQYAYAEALHRNFGLSVAPKIGLQIMIFHNCALEVIPISLRFGATHVTIPKVTAPILSTLVELSEGLAITRKIAPIDRELGWKFTKSWFAGSIFRIKYFL